jgi:hypothetical protein
MPGRSYVNTRRSSPAEKPKEFEGLNFARGHQQMLIQGARDAVRKIERALRERDEAAIVRAVQSANQAIRDAFNGPQVDGKAPIEQLPPIPTDVTFEQLGCYYARLG